MPHLDQTAPGSQDARFVWRTNGTYERRVRSIPVCVLPGSNIYPFMRKVLTERYGSPTGFESKPMQTAGGAQFSVETVTWKGRDRYIVLREVAGSVGDRRVAGIIIGSHAVDEVAAAKETERVRVVAQIF